MLSTQETARNCKEARPCLVRPRMLPHSPRADANHHLRTKPNGSELTALRLGTIRGPGGHQPLLINLVIDAIEMELHLLPQGEPRTGFGILRRELEVGRGTELESRRAWRWSGFALPHRSTNCRSGRTSCRRQNALAGSIERAGPGCRAPRLRNPLDGGGQTIAAAEFGDAAGRCRRGRIGRFQHLALARAGHAAGAASLVLEGIPGGGGFFTSGSVFLENSAWTGAGWGRSGGIRLRRSGRRCKG